MIRQLRYVGNINEFEQTVGSPPPVVYYCTSSKGSGGMGDFVRNIQWSDIPPAQVKAYADSSLGDFSSYRRYYGMPRANRNNSNVRTEYVVDHPPRHPLDYDMTPTTVTPLTVSTPVMMTPPTLPDRYAINHHKATKAWVQGQTCQTKVPLAPVWHDNGRAYCNANAMDVNFSTNAGGADSPPHVMYYQQKTSQQPHGYVIRQSDIVPADAQLLETDAYPRDSVSGSRSGGGGGGGGVGAAGSGGGRGGGGGGGGGREGNENEESQMQTLFVLAEKNAELKRAHAEVNTTVKTLTDNVSRLQDMVGAYRSANQNLEEDVGALSHEKEQLAQECDMLMQNMQYLTKVAKTWQDEATSYYMSMTELNKSKAHSEQQVNDLIYQSDELSKKCDRILMTLQAQDEKVASLREEIRRLQRDNSRLRKKNAKLMHKMSTTSKMSGKTSPKSKNPSPLYDPSATSIANAPPTSGRSSSKPASRSVTPTRAATMPASLSTPDQRPLSAPPLTFATTYVPPQPMVQSSSNESSTFGTGETYDNCSVFPPLEQRPSRKRASTLGEIAMTKMKLACHGLGMGLGTGLGLVAAATLALRYL